MLVVWGIAFEREQWDAQVEKLRTGKSENAITDTFFNIFTYLYDFCSVLCAKICCGVVSLEKRRSKGDFIDLQLPDRRVEPREQALFSLTGREQTASNGTRRSSDWILRRISSV